MKTVIYHGEHLTHFGKIYQLFKDKKGIEYNYTGVKMVWPGLCYELLPGDKMNRRPNQITDYRRVFEMTENDWVKSEAQKIAVKGFRLEQRKAMEVKKPHLDITTAINLLKPFYRGLSRFDQKSFVSYLENEMSKRKK